MQAAQRLLEGDRRALSRLISYLERGDPAAAEVMEAIDGHTGKAYTVGITGPPGAGKSTVAEQLTQLLRREGRTVGIIAVDPTSPFSGGALLGDRIRMQKHSLDSGVFIRSVATRGQLGGLPRTIKSMVRLLDAAGTEVVLVETVGVGQAELEILGVADTVLVALMPDSGDAIQTLKAGIMEIADIYLVNKSDREGANQMAASITAMLNMAGSQPAWAPPVMLTQANLGTGIPELWDKVQDHRRHITATSELERRRAARREQEFLETVMEHLERRLRSQMAEDPRLVATLEKVGRKEAEPYSSAIEFLASSPFSHDWSGSSANDDD